MSKEEAIKEIEKQIEIQKLLLNKGSNYRFLFNDARIMIQIYELAIACLDNNEINISNYDFSIDETIERLERLISDLNQDIIPENSSASAYGKVARITEALQMSVNAMKNIKIKSQYSEEDEIKKAIRYFQCMADDAQVVLDSGFGTHPGESDLVYRNRKRYATLTMEALNKQLGQKPVRPMGGDPACPCCGMVVKQGNKLKCMYYCHYCGQKLLWEE